MKTNLAIILSIFYSLLTINFSFSQIKKTVNQPTTVVEERSITLNGGLRSSVGGKSRVLIPIDLPKNTVEWYYSFTTVPAESGTDNLNLMIQLSNLVSIPGIVPTSIVENLKVPKGSNTLDVFLIDEKNRIPFEGKWDNSGGVFYSIPQGTTKNTKQAVVRIDEILSGRCYLGLKNPSSLDGINVLIEVTAIVKSEVYIDEWSEQSINTMTASCLKSFISNINGQSDVCDCLIDKIISSNKPSSWLKLKPDEKENINQSIMDRCFDETNNSELKKAELEIKKKEEDLRMDTEQQLQLTKQMINSAKAAAEFGDYDEAIHEMAESIDKVLANEELLKKFGDKRIALMHNHIAWWSLLSGNKDLCQQHIKLGLSKDPNSMKLRATTGFFHLVYNNYEDARNAFSAYRKKDKFEDGTKWIEYLSERMKILENKGITNSDFTKIKNEFRIK